MSTKTNTMPVSTTSAKASPVNLDPVSSAPVATYRNGVDIAEHLIGNAIAFLDLAKSGKASDASGVTVDGLKALAVAVVFPSKMGDNYGTPSLSKSGAIVASPARTLALSAAFAQAEAAHALEAGGVVNNLLRKMGADPDRLPFTRQDKRDFRSGKQLMALAPRWAAAKSGEATGM